MSKEQYSNLSEKQKNQITNGTLQHSEAIGLGQTLGKKIDALGYVNGGTRVDTEVKEINGIINDVIYRSDKYFGLNFDGFGVDKLHNGSVSSVYDNCANKLSDRIYGEANDGITKHALANAKGNLVTFNLQSWTGCKESGSSVNPTVENLQNSYVHEAGGHFFRSIGGGDTKEHGRATQLQMSHSSWKGTTPAFKSWITTLNNLFKSQK